VGFDQAFQVRHQFGQHGGHRSVFR
jgi:hypothetical protein